MRGMIGLAWLFVATGLVAAAEPFAIPQIDIDGKTEWQVVVDREPGQYLGHPTTTLLPDGQTLLCVYPKGHGRGAIVYKRSSDAGRTWSDRLPVPENWSTSLETPTLHQVTDSQGVRRIIMFSGLYPVRMAVSEDDGKTWTPLAPVGDWGGIVTMGSVVERRSGPGEYLALFHDDGRFFRASGTETPAAERVMTLYQSASHDGGLTWEEPEAIFASAEIHLCEPGVIRSPSGRELAMLLRENRRRKNSHVMFSGDEGKSWSRPVELPRELTGDRHTGGYLPDGRVFLSFRDTAKESPTFGDWVAWVGRYEDIRNGEPGEYRMRLKDNTHKADCAYPGVEILKDGTIVTTTYGHWEAGEPPYILCLRLPVEDLDRIAREETKR